MKKAVLVVSFGTSYHETRKKTIEVCERKISEKLEEYDFYRAFTSNMIINKLKKRDNMFIDNPVEALQKLADAGYEEVVVQTLHIICGEEYNKLKEQVESFKPKFKKIALGRPLLTTIDDYRETVDAVKKQLDIIQPDEAVVFMGHGTTHESHSAYPALEYMFRDNDMNVYIGTVEGYPELEQVIKKLKADNIKTVDVMPFMLVAGDHATNDMASDEEDSWKSNFESKGVFNSVECQIEGLGSIEELQNLYVSHINDALEKDPIVIEDKSDNKTALEDGIYSAKFETDSGMFKNNETKEGRGILTVKDGKMTMEIVLSGDGIVGLYEGLAKDAKNDEKNRINCSKVTVKYDDGSEEEVNSFVIDVPVLDKEFDLALIGKKEKWYDHKVIVSDVKPVE